MKVTGIPIVLSALGMPPPQKKTGGMRIQENRDHLDHNIGKVGEKSPGDLRRLAVTQTPVKDHQQTLMWKTLKDKHNNNNNNNNNNNLHKKLKFDYTTK